MHVKGRLGRLELTLEYVDSECRADDARPAAGSSSQRLLGRVGVDPACDAGFLEDRSRFAHAWEVTISKGLKFGSWRQSYAGL